MIWGSGRLKRRLDERRRRGEGFWDEGGEGGGEGRKSGKEGGAVASDQ